MKKDLTNILIVDDEVDICFLIKSVLKRSSTADIDICNSVDEAKKKMAEKKYDLAFFDMRLNDGTGEDLVNFVESTVNQSPYIAVISAYTSDSDMKKLEALAIDEFIAKPLTSNEIINCYLSASA